jgi:hypothetical protein
MNKMGGINSPGWMAIYMQQQRLAKVKRAGGAVVPGPVIDYLMVVGSSTPQESFGPNVVRGRQEQNARSAMAAAGIDVPIINNAVGGQTIAALDAAINGYLTGLNPLKKVGVLIWIGNNDIGVTSYGDMLQATKDAMLAGLNSIINKVLAANCIPILVPVNSRKTSELLYEEWADQLYRPLCQSRTPNWYASPLAVMDLCRLYLINKDVVDWWQVDDIHPNVATPSVQAYVATQLAAYATAKPMAAPTRYIFGWGATGQNIGGINYVVGAASGTISTVYNAKGQLDAAASLTWANANGSSGGSRGNPGVREVDLTNNLIQSGSVFRSSAGNITFTANFGAGRASASGVAKFTGNSSTAARVTRFTIGAQTGLVNCSVGINVLELPFTLDGAGSITFTGAAETPATIANVSGVEFQFN